MPTKGSMDPSVSVATVVAIEDFGNRKARILVFVTDMHAGSMVEVAASGTQREKAGNTAVLIAIDRQLAGVISIADQIKPEAKAAIDQLRHAGVKQAIMLTGDNRHTAQLVGDELGLDAVHAELLPQDKVKRVNELKNQGYRVAMVGDGRIFVNMDEFERWVESQALTLSL